MQRPVEMHKSRRPAHVGALDCLPLFFCLEDRKVLVAGGSEAAAWKAELLAAAGARVHVYAVTLTPAFRTLIAEGSCRGGFVHHAQAWTEDSFKDASLAIADAVDAREAEAFCAAARAKGVPVNVIDKPEFCAFQFGSIVNRSPVVVGISTNGVAPILGQAIRRRIETLLPAAIQNWAVLAGRLRQTTLEFLQPGQQRRRFWDRFSELAFSSGQEPDLKQEAAARDLITQAMTGGEGRVTLVGAGPGDAEFLTLKAVRALQSADVILFDDLVDDAVLELARREAKRLLVGKRGGRESCRQEDINEMMVNLARQGKHVVRLKSGDPMIFGRAGEELARLQRENIPAAVVPGVTSASAMAARLGVSLTHRDRAQSVRFVTGHSRHGKLPETVDWAGLNDPATTTVFYMGARMSGQIRNRLLDEGLSPHTPAVAVSGIASVDEARWQGTLETLARGVEGLGLERPVLIGIGRVFAQQFVNQVSKPRQDDALEQDQETAADFLNVSEGRSANILR